MSDLKYKLELMNKLPCKVRTKFGGSTEEVRRPSQRAGIRGRNAHKLQEIHCMLSVEMFRGVMNI